MGNRQGTLLEKNVDRMFRLAGFQTKRNAIVNGYEVDVLAKIGNIKIPIQCKQYERSYLNVKDILHQWQSKRNKLNADKILLVVFGQEISISDKKLAKELDIALWDETDIDKIDNLVVEKKKDAFTELLKRIGLDVSGKKVKNNSNTLVLLILAGLSAIIFPPLLIAYGIGFLVWLVMRGLKKR